MTPTPTEKAIAALELIAHHTSERKYMQQTDFMNLCDDINRIAEKAVSDTRSVVPVTITGDGGTYQMKPGGYWCCFHCGEVFYMPEKARLHFGEKPKDHPVCVDLTALKQEARGEGHWITVKHKLLNAAFSVVGRGYDNEFAIAYGELADVFDAEVLPALTAPDERTLPELPEGWNYKHVEYFSISPKQWRAWVEKDNANLSVVGFGPTPRVAVLAARAKIGEQNG